MNRVANFALRVVLPLYAKLEAGRCGGESAERFLPDGRSKSKTWECHAPRR